MFSTAHTEAQFEGDQCPAYLAPVAGDDVVPRPGALLQLGAPPGHHQVHAAPRLLQDGDRLLVRNVAVQHLQTNDANFKVLFDNK